MSSIPTTAQGALPQETLAPPRGFFAWVSSVDHKKIGLMYLMTCLAFFVLAGFMATVMRTQLMRPNNHLLSPAAYNQLFTMHGTTMIFLVLVPALIGLATYVMPLMIGARDMAFPRLNQFSYWIFLFGALLLYYSFFAHGGPDAGWFAYTPLSEKAYSFTQGMTYWALGLLVVGVGTVAAGINQIVTIFNLRTEGMTIRRLPLFVWMVLVNSFLIIFALPALNAAQIMLLLDRLMHASFFTASTGGSPILWEHYFWIFGHPEVYIMVLPAFGVISEVIPVFSRKPIFGYAFLAASTVAIGFLSFSVWVHHMFAVGLSFPIYYAFAAGSLLIAVPTGVKIFNWIATMWGGSLVFSTAMLFSMAFIVEFTMGGLSGVIFAAVPLDWQLTDTYFVVAHFHYVLFGGTALALFSAAYYWFPKMTGRLLDERLGKLNFALIFVGFNMAFFLQHFAGMAGMPRRVYTFPPLPWLPILNLLSTIGAYIIAFGVLVFLINIFVSLRRGAPAGDNPWDAWSLEWATTSPPPEHNFERVPPVRGRRPLYDLAHPEPAASGKES